MSDEDDRDSAPGFRPRRSTVSAKRRSLRVPVDEVPRRSSPGLARPTFDKVADARGVQGPDARGVQGPDARGVQGPDARGVQGPDARGGATERSMPRVVSSEPLPALRTDPGVNVELADEDIEVEESREMEAVDRAAGVPPVRPAPPSPTEESEPEMVLASAELDAAAFGDLAEGSDELTLAAAASATVATSDDLASPSIGVATSPEGEPAPTDDVVISIGADEPSEIVQEPTQVSQPPMRPSLEIVDRPTTEFRRASEPAPAAASPRASSPSVAPGRPSSADVGRASQPVIISQVVVVSRAISVAGSPSSAPPSMPSAAPVDRLPAAPLPLDPSGTPVVDAVAAKEPELVIDPDGDPFELDVEVAPALAAPALAAPALAAPALAAPALAAPALAAPALGAEEEEPIRLSQVPELTDEVAPEELGADEILEDAPPAPKSIRSSPPPRPERTTGRVALLTPTPPAMPPSVSGAPSTGPVVPPLPPPPPVPSTASMPALSAPAAAPAAASPSPAAAAPAAVIAPPPPAPPAAPPAPPSAAAAHAEPPTDPRRTKKKGAWWEDLFNDDYLRTVPAPHPKQVVRQCDFIEARLGLVRGATLLDVGCGLGLHAIELTRRGYLVVGLDLSLPMLSRAADEAQDQGFKINFLHADMREMNFEGAFDAVLSWGTSFGYFDDDVNRTVLDRIHRALKPGGLLLLDLVNRDYVIRTQPNNVWFEGDGCVVMEETQCNYINSRLQVKRTVMLDDGRQRESAYAIRLYSLHELGQMLHKSFRVVEVSGREATPGVFFGADSPRLLVVAERRLATPPGPPAPPKKPEGDPSVSSSMPAVASAAPPPPHDPES